MNAKNTDIHMQQLDFGIQSPDCWEVLFIADKPSLYASLREEQQHHPTGHKIARRQRGNHHHNMLQQYHYTMILKYQLQDDLLLRVLMQVAKNKQPQIVR